MGEDSIERRVSVLESEVKDIKDTCKDINDRLIRMEEGLKTNNNKTESNEKTNERYAQAILEMSGSVKLLTEKVSDMIVKLDKQDCRIKAVEDKPGKAALNAWRVIVTTACTATIVAVIAYLGRGGWWK